MACSLNVGTCNVVTRESNLDRESPHGRTYPVRTLTPVRTKCASAQCRAFSRGTWSNISNRGVVMMSAAWRRTEENWRRQRWRSNLAHLIRVATEEQHGVLTHSGSGGSGGGGGSSIVAADAAGRCNGRRDPRRHRDYGTVRQDRMRDRPIAGRTPLKGRLSLQMMRCDDTMKLHGDGMGSRRWEPQEVCVRCPPTTREA